MRTCVTASTHQACVCVMVLGVCVSVSANTLSVRVCVCVNYGCVCERQHAHITIERLLWQLLPRRLQCYLVYGRRHLNTCPIFPQSPSHGIGPRISTGTTAAKWHLGRLFLQLLPLVSNKHLISLSSPDPAAKLISMPAAAIFPGDDAGMGDPSCSFEPTKQDSQM